MSLLNTADRAATVAMSTPSRIGGESGSAASRTVTRA
jgi:hypothetical protein